MIVFTSICANYLHKARTLATSVKQNIPDAHFFVCLTERERMSATNYTDFDEVVLSKEMWAGNFERFIYKHAIVEASTAVKGRFFQYLMEKYPDENAFVYLDPDCYVYSDFTELKELLQKKPIVLCPHLLHPGNIDMELSSTAHGVYNLGFLAVNHSEEAGRFIDWWAERLYLFCYDDIKRGIFTDQKWIDLAPCFFDVEILKHDGYDFAPWSLLNCGMTKEDSRYFVQGFPLRFIHFSGYGASAEKCMRDWLPEGAHPFRDLYAEYSKLHDGSNADKVSRTPWSYSCYTSGEKIDDRLRAKYRTDYDVMFSIEDPFQLSNREMKNKLRRSGQEPGFREKMRYVLDKEGIKGLVARAVRKVRNGG
ncbi:MAG: hypothetical protein NC548_46590 [Lachnospiraceae bacterium]|nr:hypothetical protein [Lachnospiraceae bacterium]